MYVLNFFGKESFKKDTMAFELMTNRLVGNVWKATGDLRELTFATIYSFEDYEDYNCSKI